MFEQSLVESSPEMKRRKRWTALLSYSMEALAVVVLLSFPLLHTEALPLDDRPTFHPPTRYSPPHVDLVNTVPPPRANNRQAAINPLLAPREIPTRIDTTPDPPRPQFASGPQDDIPDGAIPVSDAREQNQALAEVLKPPPIKPVPHAAVARVSKSMESMLIRQVKPVYPPIAIAGRIQGVVILQAVISRQGAIEQLQLVSGHPMLVNAAMEAVRQWRYRPYVLNGDPVEVDTRITVNFTLSGN